MRIGITGTPCTGKTTIAKKIGKTFDYEIISLTDFVKENKFWVEYDKERDTYIIDEEKVLDRLIKILKEKKDNYIVEGHFLDLIPSEFFDIIFVFRTPIKMLRERLEKRNYPKKKIEENIEAEIMEICLTDALYEYGPEKVVIINTGKTVEEVLIEIEKRISKLKGD